MNDPICILLAEDHLVARVGVTTIVNMQPDMTVVAEASNGQQAVELYRRHQPDVTLLDLRMPVMGGVEAALVIRSEFPGARMIALTTYGGDEDIRRALHAGVQAYLTKDVLHDELLKAIRAVHAGERYLPAAVSAALSAQSPRADLSAREIQVLKLIVQGARQQADRLPAEHRRAHREESREEHSQQARGAGPDAGCDCRHPTRHSTFVREETVHDHRSKYVHRQARYGEQARRTN